MSLWWELEEGQGHSWKKDKKRQRYPKSKNCTEVSGNSERFTVVGTQDVCRLLVGNATGEVGTNQQRVLKATKATSIYRWSNRGALDMLHF